jgi:phospholipase/carboxylesterase
MTDLQAFTHRFVPAEKPGRRPLLLLHGTGGDENDLVPLAQSVAPGAALLSPRGQVLERGMPRFFRRLAEGVFDPEEVRTRTHELADFVRAALDAYRLQAPIALGFSNGANIAATLMLLRPRILAGAILLRPMTVLEHDGNGLDGAPVLMLSGSGDPIVAPESARRLATLLAQAGAAVDHRFLAAGHQLSREDLAIAADWLARNGGGGLETSAAKAGSN